MQHKIAINDRIAKRVYELFGSGVQLDGMSYLEEILKFLEDSAKAKAMGLCQEAPETNISKEYDRGYVKGIIEVLSFFDRAKQHGSDLWFKKPESNLQKIPY